MWASHAAHHGSRAQTRTAKRNGESATATATAFGPFNTDSSSRSRPATSRHQYTVSALEAENYADFFEPAVEGPPSPAAIRALSDQVKQASVSERHASQMTTSPTAPGASSLLSYSSLDRRPSWEQALDSFSISRKSSIRSTTSSMPSKERRESVQAFGKAIFHRKSRLRSEGFTSPDLSFHDRGQVMSVLSKDHLQATRNLFNRRKTMQPGEAAQKKPAISNPFNFQHVAQIQREQLPDLERRDPSTLHSELAGVPTSAGWADDLHVPNFASGGARPRDEQDLVPPHVAHHSRDSSVSRPRQWLKQRRSQDQVYQVRGTPPPRPPRSPTQLNMGYFDSAPPPAPARHPGRSSVPRRDSESLGIMVPGTMVPGPSQSMASFCFPSTRHESEDARSPQPESPAPLSPFAEDRRYSRIFMPAESPNWPLPAPLQPSSSVTTFETALAEVPEEEEQCVQPARSHTREKSTNSSLKGSVSVPMLRTPLLPETSQAPRDRAFSRDSVVLGTFDMSTCRRIVEDDASTSAEVVYRLRRDSWEAVIDYCYEHEMEANCDYDWHRSSAEDQEPAAMVTDTDSSTVMSRLPSDFIELPVLSPSHHLSPQSSQEVITPRLSDGATSPPPRANFSLPHRHERPKRLLHVRNEAPNYLVIEAQGFSLSPSCLIPTDYHQELLAAQTEKLQQPEVMIAQGVADDDDGDSDVAADHLFTTTASRHTNLSSPSSLSPSPSPSPSSPRSALFEQRHVSATSSTATDYTRLTNTTSGGSPCVDVDGFPFTDAARPPPLSTGPSESLLLVRPPPPLPPALAHTHARAHSVAGLLGGAGDRVGPGLSRDTHSSVPDLASTTKSAAGRARSRTLSSTPGTFSLFPTVARAPPRF